jgi:hypothetical protein
VVYCIKDAKTTTAHSKVQSEHKTAAYIRGKKIVSILALSRRGLRKDLEISSEHSRSWDRDMKSESPENNAGVLSISPCHMPSCCFGTFSKETWK